MVKKIVVGQDAEKPVEAKVLAQAIVDISKAARALANSGLNQKAIIVLTAHAAGQPQYVVKQILDSLQQLQRDYCAKPDHR